MNKRGTGLGFCLISGILFAARYIAAAIYMANSASQGADLFRAGLSYTDKGLFVVAMLSLAIGAIYIICGEIEEKKK